MKTLSSPTRILLIGASGGLGSALAQHYARPGVRLWLWGRDLDRLHSVAQACKAAGASATIRSLDLADIPAALKALSTEDDAAAFDLAVFAAGRGDIRPAGQKVEDAATVAHLGTLNFVAPAAMAAMLAERMAARGGGSIVLVGSAAAFHALPFAAAYSASKAGLARFADALRIGLRRYGVRVTLVSPGFIDTAAGRQVAGPKPMIMQPRQAAARIAQAAAVGKAHVVMPWPFGMLRILDRLLPGALRDRLLLKLTPPGE